jgi:hypothetical protein
MIDNEPYEITQWCAFSGPHPNDGQVTYCDNEAEARLFLTLTPNRRLAKRTIHYSAWDIIADEDAENTA